jgi:Flp pilus assembly protein TadD
MSMEQSIQDETATSPVGDEGREPTDPQAQPSGASAGEVDSAPPTTPRTNGRQRPSGGDPFEACKGAARASEREPKRRAVSGSTQMRLSVATWLRMSDSIVSKAVSAYDKLFSLDPRDEAEIYTDIGSELGASGRPEEALASLERAVGLRPDDEQVWFELGMVHLRMGASEAAKTAFEKARALGAEGFDLALRLSEALTDLDRHEEAVKELQKAVNLDPHAAEAFYRLGVELDRINRHEEAVTAFRKAIELAPREHAYYQSLGFTLDTLGQRDEAVDCFKRAVDLQRRMERLGAR